MVIHRCHSDGTLANIVVSSRSKSKGYRVSSLNGLIAQLGVPPGPTVRDDQHNESINELFAATAQAQLLPILLLIHDISLLLKKVFLFLLT